MGDIIHRTTYEYKWSVNSPSYPEETWLHNPDLSGVSGVHQKYWKVVGDTVVEMNQTEKDAVDAAETAAIESALENRAAEMMVIKHAHTASSDIWEYVEDNAIWTDTVSGLKGPPDLIQTLVNRREIYGDSDNPVGEYSGNILSRIANYDTLHGKLGWHHQQVLKALYHRPKDLMIYYGWLRGFNAVWDNEANAKDFAQYGLLVFGNGLQTIIATGSHTGSDNASTLSDNTKSWTTNEHVGKYLYNVDDKCIGTITGNTSDSVSCSGGYSGGTDNDFDNGDEYRIVSHQDYANTVAIITRIKQLNPDSQIFGYVSTDQTLTDFEKKSDDWDVLGVHGIFMDESGYDYGRTRGEFNDRVDYVHSLSNANLVMANAWNTDHILGTDNDTSYPNTTYNSSSDESSLTTNDWILLESLPLNTTAYTASTPDGYETKGDWATRCVKAQGLRQTYRVNFAACGIVDDATTGGQDMFDFSFTAACMFAWEGHGICDTSYGSSSGKGKWWTRPNVFQMGHIYTLNANVQVDGADADVYWRYTQFGKFKLDFSDNNNQDSEITKR